MIEVLLCHRARWAPGHPGLGRICAITLLALIGLLLPALAQATVSGSVDRDPVAIDESFTLLFSTDGEPDGDPDFRPLDDDFELLHQSQSTHVTMNNGQLSRRTTWSLAVRAKRLGSVTVPSIPFGRDRSSPFGITVVPGQAATRPATNPGGDDLLLEVDAEPRNPYVQAQVLLTLRILHRVALRGGQLEDPKLSDAIVQKLGDDRRYQVERHGQRFGVIERRFAIFPQKSGPLHIEPLTLEAEASIGAGSMFDQFFGSQSSTRRVRSSPITLQVRPIPAGIKGRQWLPAAKLQLEEHWSSDPPETSVGEPVTRTLSVRGDGVTMGMLPELGAKSPDDGALQQYPDQPALKEDFGAQGLNSSRREKTAFIPTRDGSYRLPGVEIAWWNTTTDRPEVARIPERTLRVKPGTNALAPRPPEPDAVAVPAEQPAAAQAPPASSAVPSTIWIWLASIFGVGWAATGAAWWWQGARNRRPTAAASPTTSGGASLKPLRALERACLSGDAAQTRTALLAWGRDRWPTDPPRNLEQIAQRVDPEFAEDLNLLNRALYSPTTDSWHGPRIYEAAAALSRTRPAHPSAGAGTDAALASLHRI
ncbi:MAG: BatD family protein [Methylotetracoccus sp.]